MIKVSRLNDQEFWLNHNMIEAIEVTPDTIIRLTNDKKLVVKEKPDEIIRRIVEFNRKTLVDRLKDSPEST